MWDFIMNCISTVVNVPSEDLQAAEQLPAESAEVCGPSIHASFADVGTYADGI